MKTPPNRPSGGGPGGQGGPGGSPNRLGRSMFGWLIILGIGLLLFTFIQNRLEDRREIPADEFWKHVRAGHIDGTILIKEQRIEAALAENVPGVPADESRNFFVVYRVSDVQEFEDRLKAAIGGKAINYKFEFSGWWESVLPHLLLMVGVFLLLWFFLFRRIGSAAGGGGFLGNFGRSKHRMLTKERVKVTFNDVAGIAEAKEEVKEIIEFLKNPRRFARLGGRVPRGVLLVGEPGCGKTLLAKAIAGEAEVPFFSISGSDFVEMFVGVGASRVRDLFKQAKDSSPCIIFLDEIDAVGRKRGVGFNGGGHDEREQTLNAILVEMDGFESSDQVIVMAATNRADVLDPALTRPGRFDRQIHVPMPDLKGRIEVLKIYVNQVKCGPDVDIPRLARATPMFSGADLEALVNEAAIAATMANKDFVEQEDLEEARDKVRWGRARKSRTVDEKEQQCTAYHEAGHAMARLLLPQADPLHKVTIIPRGPAGGATFSLPEKDIHYYTRTWCDAQLKVCFAGRIAEEMFTDEISSGAAGDIAQATHLARKMVLDWGMSEQLGPVQLSSEDGHGPLPRELSNNSYSDQTAKVIDEEVRRIVTDAQDACRLMLGEHRDELERLANALLKHETLSAEEAQRIVDGEELDKPTVGDLLEKEQSRGTGGPPVRPAVEAPEFPDAGPLPEPS